MAKEVQSPVGKLNETDYKKLIKSIGIAFGGAFAFSVLVWLQAWLSTGTIDWNSFTKSFFTSCMPAALAVGINAVMKLLKGPQ